jgi:hypothetical protein
MKTVYQTDFDGFFTAPVDADPSPLEPGVWLIPGGAVEVEPPALKDGQRARWNGKTWDVIDPPPPPPPPPPAPEPTPEELIEAQRVCSSLSRFDFASRAAQAGFVTYAEAAAWATGQAMPAKVQALIETLPEEQRGPILLDVLAMPTIRRNGSIMPAIIAAFEATEEQADALFGIGV